jgi:hypothetical protein
VPWHIGTDMFKGVSAPWWIGAVFPVLTPASVVRDVLDAVRCRRREVVLPGYYWPMLLLAFVLPTAVRDWLLRLAGCEQMGESFIGRGKGLKNDEWAMK